MKSASGEAKKKTVRKSQMTFLPGMIEACPGPTDTPLFAAQPEKLKEALVKAIPFRRLARPEEVAAPVLLFASDAASFITSQVISVSGGLTMAG
jgi:2-hydroxycyclohexanecarboxyl-CoA dehydrogenase